MIFTRIKQFIVLGTLLLLGVGFFLSRSESKNEETPLSKVERRHFDVTVKTVGELEAAKSTIIASSIRGDLGKIIFMVPDGVNVKPDDVLIKMDPTPFEEKLENIASEIKEQIAYIQTLEKTLVWEVDQSEHELKTAEFEIETAHLEMEKLIKGDGPLETAKLRSAMLKSELKYNELAGYSEDLQDLQRQGFLNPNEIKQAMQKLSEEKEAYDSARMQYECYITHTYPMLVTKHETSIKRSKIKMEDVIKTAGYKIGKSQASLEQSQQALEDLHIQLREAKKELALTEIKAPAQGMVVHREEYRSGQRRKPRVGDILVKNQALMDLPDLDSMLVKTKVREIDLFKVAIGKKACIQVDSYPQASFSGTVHSIGVLALSGLSGGSEEKCFELRVTLDNPDERLRPGMTSRVTIYTQSIENELSIPLHSIFEDEEHCYCYVSGVNGYEKRDLKIGACNDQWAEVRSGLEEGEQVCLINPFLRDHE